MRLIKPFYEILNDPNTIGENVIIAIEKAARTCYKSEHKIIRDEAKNIAISGRDLVRKLISNKHEAMLEFGGNIAVKFTCDRGVSHELVRHRLASFAQESTRYCNYGNDHVTFIIPHWLRISEGIYSSTPVTTPSSTIWMNNMLYCESAYKQLLFEDWTPQLARDVLPNALKTEINISANIREWRHIFKLRCASSAHPSMRNLMIPLLLEFNNKIPIIFDDLVGNLTKIRL